MKNKNVLSDEIKTFIIIKKRPSHYQNGWHQKETLRAVSIRWELKKTTSLADSKAISRKCWRAKRTTFLRAAIQVIGAISGVVFFFTPTAKYCGDIGTCVMISGCVHAFCNFSCGFMTSFFNQSLSLLSGSIFDRLFVIELISWRDALGSWSHLIH